MVSCAALGCSNRSDRKGPPDAPKVTFHQFPKNVVMRAKWTQAVNRPDWEPAPRSCLCSAHFAENCFDRLGNNTKLFPHAVPTIFTVFRFVQQTQTSNDEQLEICPDINLTELKIESFKNEPNNETMDEEVPQEEASSPFSSFSLDPRIRPAPSSHEKLIQSYKEKIQEYKNELVLLKQNNRRYKTKIEKLYKMRKNFKHTNLLLEEKKNLLENLTDVNREILKRQAAKSRNRGPRKVYSSELRKFALTLHYYSPKAYNYVREKFATCLPHPQTLANWYKIINGKPSFSEESFAAICNTTKHNDEEILAALIGDSIP